MHEEKVEEQDDPITSGSKITIKADLGKKGVEKTAVYLI